MRWMRAARFDVGIVMRVLSKKAYPCDIDVKVELKDKADIEEAFRAGATIPAVKAPVDGWAVDTDAPGLPQLKYGTVRDPLPADGWRRIKYNNMGELLLWKGKKSTLLRCDILVYVI